MKEICVHCGQPTAYDIHTPVHLRRYYIDGSGQLCEQCFSQLYSYSSAFSVTPTPGKQGKTEEQEKQEEPEQIKTIKLPSTATPTEADKERYRELTSKEALTPQDREELARLYKKYTV